MTDTAIADLVSIGRYIRRDNPARAETFLVELKEACRRLADMPSAYALVPGYEEHSIRRRPYGNYLIFYRAEEKTVVVLHVLNGAQDYESILFPKPE
nr:type II toxin-antitoxin system RelE/ParE family toxin [Jiella avicenniae]